MHSFYHPVAIVGGGIVGKLLALSIGRIAVAHGLSLPLLVTGNTPSPPRTNERFSNRVSFINPASIRLFQELDLWESIFSKGAYPVSAMKIFSSELPGLLHPSTDGSFLSFNGSDCTKGGNILGYIIQNNAIEQSLDSMLKELSVPQLAQRKLTCIKNDDPSNISFGVEGGDVFSTSLLLGCDGGNSKIRTLLADHFHYFSSDYDAIGMVATLTTSVSSTKGTAFQRYLPSGPIAALPLSPCNYSLVWSFPKSWKDKKLQDAHILNMAFYAPFAELESVLFSHKTVSIDDFIGKDSILKELGQVIKVSSPGFFPLRRGIVSSSISMIDRNLRVILMGDAAHSVHPHAGQGLNMGISDVSALRTILASTLPLGIDPGILFNMLIIIGSYESILKPYAAIRDAKNIAMCQGIDGILKSFMLAQNDSIYSFIQQKALSAINSLSPLRKLAVSIAST